jgi:hypothetical protein
MAKFQDDVWLTSRSNFVCTPHHPWARGRGRYGSLSLFYGGLESLLGPPKMYKGAQHEDKSLFNTMEYEHTCDKDAKTKFKAPNGVSTSPSLEWECVCAPSKDVEYPERHKYRENHPEW